MSKDDNKNDGVVDDKRDINSFVNVNQKTSESINEFVKESRKDRANVKNESSKASARYNRDALREYFERTTRDDAAAISRKNMHSQLDDINVSLKELLKSDKKKDEPFNFMSMLPLLTAGLVTALSIAKPDVAKPPQTAVKSTMTLAGAGADALKALNAAKGLSSSVGILGTIGKSLGKYADSPMMKKLVRFSSGGMIAGRALDEDYVGAAGETASLAMHEAAAKVNNPKTKIALTAASLGTDAALIIRDMFRSKDKKESDESNKDVEQNVTGTIEPTKKDDTGSAMLMLPALAALAVPLLMSKKFAIPNILGGKSTTTASGAPIVQPSSAIDAVEKGAGTIGSKGVGVAAKGIAKAGMKSIPFVGAALGAYGAVTRASEGDYKGAAMEAASGILSFVPVIGTAASLAIQGGLMYRDAVKANSNETAKINTISKDGIVSLNNAGVKNAEQSMIASDMIKESSATQKENSNKITEDMKGATSSYLDMTKTMSFGLIGFTTSLGLKFTDWVFGADNMFRKAANSLSSVSDGIMGWIKKGVFGGVVGAVTGAFGGSGSAPEADANAKGSNLHSTRKNNMVAVYDSFKKAGMSEAQAKAMTAEIGRENDFGNDLWKTHKDDKNGKTNVGMMSWQNGRDKKLLEYLGKEGVLNKDGSIQRTKAALDAQARFVMMELKGDYKKKVGDKFLSNKDISYKDASKMLGQDYIGWAYDNEKYANGHKRRDDHFANLNTELYKRGDSKIPEKKVTYISQKDYNKIIKAEPKPPMMASREIHNTWSKNEAERVKKYTATQSGILSGTVKVGTAPKEKPKSNVAIPYANAGGSSAESNAESNATSGNSSSSSNTSKDAAAKVDFDLDKICAYALSNARFKSRAARAADKKTDYLCAKYVRMAIQQGDNTKKVGSLGHAREWGKSLPAIGWNPASGGLRKGDIAWFPTGISGYGHVCIWTGKVWVSDFIQGDNPQPNSKKTLEYKLYRAKSGYTNNNAVGAEVAGGATTADQTSEGSEGSEGKEQSVMERVQAGLVTGIASIGAGLFDNQFTKDAIGFMTNVKTDAYGQNPDKKDAVNMDGFDKELKPQDAKGFKYKFSDNGFNRADLYSKEILRQKDYGIDHLGNSGKLGGIQRQYDTKIDHLGNAGNLGGIQRQYETKIDHLGNAGNLGGIIRQENTTNDHLGMAGNLGGIQRQGDGKKKQKWYDKLFGGKYTDIFGGILGAFGLGDIFNIGKGVYGAAKNDDLLGYGLGQLTNVLGGTQSGYGLDNGLGGFGNDIVKNNPLNDILKIGLDGVTASKNGNLFDFGLNTVTDILSGKVGNPFGKKDITKTPEQIREDELVASLIKPTDSLDMNGILQPTVESKEGVVGTQSGYGLDNGLGGFGNDIVKNNPLNDILKIGVGGVTASKNGNLFDFGLNTLTDILSGKVGNPFGKKDITKTPEQIREDELVASLIKPTDSLDMMNPEMNGILQPTVESKEGVVGDPIADMKRDISAIGGGGLGAALSAKNDRDLLAKSLGKVPSIDLKPSLEANQLSPDHEGRGKIDGLITDTNKMYNSMKNAPPPPMPSGDAISPLNGSGTTPTGSRSGVGDGLSSALVTRNPDSIFREVSISIMKATLT